MLSRLQKSKVKTDLKFIYEGKNHMVPMPSALSGIRAGGLLDNNCSNMHSTTIHRMKTMFFCIGRYINTYSF